MSDGRENTSGRRARGQFTRHDTERLRGLDRESLLRTATGSESAAERSAAFDLLAQRSPAGDPAFTGLLLERLAQEKALYTRIGICRILERGDDASARLMLAYLGRIGSNRHKEVPGRISLKKSYPLPRDIVARILGRMNIRILPLLLENLGTAGREQAAETIDAIGYLCSRNPDSPLSGCVETLETTLSRFPGDELIAWKTALCLSAVAQPESAALLGRIREAGANATLRAECDKSLRAIARKGR